MLLVPAANNRGRQKFCGEAACRKAAKVLANRKWRQKNPGYDSGPVPVARTQEWRGKNPGYSGRSRRKKPGVALQDFAPPQGAGIEAVMDFAVGAASDFAQSKPGDGAAESRNGGPLQDLAPIQELLVVGLISVVMGDALQDRFVDFQRELVERGRRVLADNPGGLAA